MFYKLFIFCIMLSLMNLGCYSTGIITRGEMERGYSSEIKVLTKDKTVYQFGNSSYKVVKDSLYGSGNQLKADYSETDFNGKIALQNIELITGQKIDEGKTALLVLGLGAAAVIIYILIDFNNDLHNSHFY